MSLLSAAAAPPIAFTVSAVFFVSNAALFQFCAQALPGLPGHLVETYVACELLKHLAFSEKGLSLWHYRTQTNIEVDFILEDRLGQITGIEVKASATVDAKDFKGLRHLQETEATIFQRGVVLYGGREVVPFGNNLWAVPLSIWWAGLR